MAATAAEADPIVEARQKFVEGAALVKNAQWALAEADPIVEARQKFVEGAALVKNRQWADAETAPIVEARQKFVEGAALVKNAQWADAETAFEESARLHPHAVTTFNIGACERAMGRYTKARALFRHS